MDVIHYDPDVTGEPYCLAGVSMLTLAVDMELVTCDDCVTVMNDLCEHGDY